MQRDGYTPAEQQRREQVRLQTAERFARGDVIKEIAHDLRKDGYVAAMRLVSYLRHSSRYRLLFPLSCTSR
jgi:hypothetical protein